VVSPWMNVAFLAEMTHQSSYRTGVLFVPILNQFQNLHAKMFCYW